MSPGSFLLHGLTLLFVGLKLTNNIDWSWWLVTLPSWGLAAVLLTLAAIAFCIAGVAWLCMTKEQRARHKAAKAMSAYRKALFQR